MAGKKKTAAERKVFKTTIFFAVYMLILAVSTFTTGNEWIIWMNYCWIFAFTVCFLIRNMADENEWNFWDYLCGGVNAVFGAIGRCPVCLCTCRCGTSDR